MSSEKQFGEEVSYKECRPPTREPLTGKHVKLHPMRPEHAGPLFKAVGGKANEAIFDYLPYDPFLTLEQCEQNITKFATSKEMQFYTIEILSSGQMVGYISFIRIEPNHRKLEIAHVVFSTALQRTTAATEVVYLMLQHSFNSNYRRVEWKTNAFNLKSRRAAERLGFTFEGVFRQDMIVKGRNRNSAWFSMLDGEWRVCREALERWMGKRNFGEDGEQRRSLQALREEVGAEGGRG